MTWLRVGEDNYINPLFLTAGALEPTNPSFRMEFIGFITCLYNVAAHQNGKQPEYEVSEISISELIVPNERRRKDLIKAAKHQGIITSEFYKGSGRTKLKYYKLLENYDMYHLYDASDSLKNTDCKNARLIASLVLRDGLHCRWCSEPVAFRPRGKRGQRASREYQMDHLMKPTVDRETTIDDVVISCRECNQLKGNPDTASPRWAKDRLLPIPKEIIVDENCKQFLLDEGYVNLHFEAIENSDRFYVYKERRPPPSHNAPYSVVLSAESNGKVGAEAEHSSAPAKLQANEDAENATAVPLQETQDEPKEQTVRVRRGGRNAH
jgi:hypothetical protein